MNRQQHRRAIFTAFATALVAASAIHTPRVNADAPEAPASGDAPTVGPVKGEQDAQDRSAENTVLKDEITPALEDSVRKGLRALVAMQNETGAFGGQRYGHHVGITGLACLALMADGNLPGGRGVYSDQVERGLEFVLNSINETGLIAAETSHGPMYGHGFATLFSRVRSTA